MLWISHRGNLRGKKPKEENSPTYIVEALTADFDVEIDVWLIGKHYYLGHDEPLHFVPENFLTHKRVWCHAKNIEALEAMLLNPVIHCFWHQNDDVVLTSRNYMWTYPGKPLTKQSICVLPENSSQDWSECAGVCSDNILTLRDRYDYRLRPQIRLRFNPKDGLD